LRDDDAGIAVASSNRMPCRQLCVTTTVPLVSPVLGLLLFSLGAAIAASGCAFAQPVLRLTPRSPDVVWVGGTGVVSQGDKNARVAVAFAREEDGRPGFRVEIQNLSPTTIIIGPSAFTYMDCTRAAAATQESCGARQGAVNPEQVLLNLDIQRSRDKAANANEATFHATMLLLDATLAVASAASGKTNGAVQAADLAGAEGNALGQVAAREDYQASAHQLERTNWATDAFRKTTIFPGKAGAGLVFVERNIKATAVWLIVQIAAQTFAFAFDQTVYSARPEYTASDSTR
jgi:hypothetical protein